MLKVFNIFPVVTDDEFSQQIQKKINQKTKPLGSLGKLETLAKQIACIQQSGSPTLIPAPVLIFAGDHGLAQAGVSAYPSDVTQQMVYNFLKGGAAINVFCRQQGLDFRVVDAGVNHDFADHPQLIQAKIKASTENCLQQAAMSLTETEQAIHQGAKIVNQFHQQGCNTLLLGEMGIGNTASASLLIHHLTDIGLDDCIGKGTGLDAVGLQNKKKILNEVKQQHQNIGDDVLAILATFGGFEIAMMAGAYLQAAENKMLMVIDGFIASAALLVASKIAPAVVDYCVFSHQSDEHGHARLLDYLAVEPLLQLDLRLGEGTGAVLAYPLLQSALAFLNEMQSFEQAQVLEKI